MMKIIMKDVTYPKCDRHTQKTIDHAAEKLLDRLVLYYNQGKTIDTIFGDDILIHDIFEKDYYVYKCYINNVQMRLLYTMKGDKLIVVSHYIKKDKPQEWLPYFKHVAKKLVERRAS